jgi:hypothetical protein
MSAASKILTDGVVMIMCRVSTRFSCFRKQPGLSMAALY